MALFPIRTFGDPVLRTVAAPIGEITSALERLVDDMFETMYDAPGVGLAAPQIGISKAIFVADIGDDPFVMINPEIVELSGEWTWDEGCLSVPERFWPIERPAFARAPWSRPPRNRNRAQWGRAHGAGVTARDRSPQRNAATRTAAAPHQEAGIERLASGGSWNAVAAMIRAIFMGTPAAAVPALAALTGVAEVVGVVTQPDVAQGRSKHKVAPPVKEAATEWGFIVHQPEDAASLAQTMEIVGFDIGIVVAYGRLLSPSVLATSRFGFLNIHFSLLPRWRGAAPVERSIIAGDTTTGVALMLLEAGLDTGPVVAAREVNIEGDDTGGILTARLAHVGADILIDSLDDFVSGRRLPAQQISGAATMAPRLTTGEAQIHGEIPVDLAERMIRGFNPRPGAWMLVDGERVKVFAATDSPAVVPPGVLQFFDDTPVVGFRGGSLELVTVQPAGNKPMTGSAWGNGRHRSAGVLAVPATI